MNISDIFFNNGQWNWEAISTISNIILVAALVLITWRYARQVRKQTTLMEKDREKNKILEEIQDVLIPTIYYLDKEIDVIRDKNKIFREKETVDELFRICYEVEQLEFSSAFKDLIGKFPDLERMFFSHDSLYYKLYELLENTSRDKELDKEIEDTLSRLKELDVVFLRSIKERREKYRKEYHFTKYDIDPELKELEEEIKKLEKEIRKLKRVKSI